MNILNMYAANVGMNPVEITILTDDGSGGSLINGRFVRGDLKRDKKFVTLQAATPKEIQFITGGQRTADIRKFYLNDGTELHPGRGDKVEISGELWTVVAADNRPWHNYCKAMIEKADKNKVKPRA